MLANAVCVTPQHRRKGASLTERTYGRLAWYDEVAKNKAACEELQRVIECGRFAQEAPLCLSYPYKMFCALTSIRWCSPNYGPFFITEDDAAHMIFLLHENRPAAPVGSKHEGEHLQYDYRDYARNNLPNKRIFKEICKSMCWNVSVPVSFESHSTCGTLA